MIGNKQRLLREKSMKNSPEKKSGSVMLSALKNFGVIFLIFLILLSLRFLLPLQCLPLYPQLFHQC